MMVKKLLTLICIASVLIFIFLPLFYAIDEANNAEDVQFSEYTDSND